MPRFDCLARFAYVHRRLLRLKMVSARNIERLLDPHTEAEVPADGGDLSMRHVMVTAAQWATAAELIEPAVAAEVKRRTNQC